MQNEKSKKNIRVIKKQVDELLSMVERDTYCGEVLERSLSIQKALKDMDSLILDNYMETHMTRYFRDKKLLKEVHNLFKLDR